MVAVAVGAERSAIGTETELPVRVSVKTAFAVPAVYTQDSAAYRVVTAIIDKIKADWVLSRLAKR